MARLWEPPEDEVERQDDWLATARGRLFAGQLMDRFPELRRAYNAAMRSGTPGFPEDVIGLWLDGRKPDAVTDVSDLVQLLEEKFLDSQSGNVTRLPPRPPA